MLLDTCTFLWIAAEPRRIRARARREIDRAETLLLSDVSVLEVCLKWQSGKIELPEPPRVWMAAQALAWMTERLPIELEDQFRMTELPSVHRDPFDRLLVAQAMRCGVPIVTPDPEIKKYPVAVVW